MKTSKVKKALGVLVLVGMGSSAYALDPIDFTGIPYVQYGDGQSYSLPITQYLTGCTGPGCTYYIASTPGAIKDEVVLGTGASGSGVTTNYAGMDGAYATPNDQGGIIYFSTPTFTDPNDSNDDTITNDYSYSWDASLSSLQSFLNGEQMVFFFNNNQTNSQGAAAQSLAAWAQLWITDSSGNIVGGIFEFTNNGGGYNIVTNGGGGVVNGDPTSYSTSRTDPTDAGPGANDYVLSGGQICINLTTSLPAQCDASDPNISAPFNHNLGANEAAYAIIFPELNALIASLSGDYTLHVDFRLGCDTRYFTAGTVECTGQDNPLMYGRELNNGYEQLFMGTTSTVTHVPEPGTIALLALGLLGLGIIGMRSYRSAR